MYILLYSGKHTREKTFTKNTIFAEQTFTEKTAVLLCQRTPRSQISQRKFSRTPTKPRSSHKFSPSKVPHYSVNHKFHNEPHMIGLPDHAALFWQTLSAVVVVFSACPLLSSQTKQALEPGVVPV